MLHREGREEARQFAPGPHCLGGGGPRKNSAEKLSIQYDTVKGGLHLQVLAPGLPGKQWQIELLYRYTSEPRPVE